MARTVYGTAARAAEEERKRQAAREAHLERVRNIIRGEANRNGMRFDREIAEAAGIPRATLSLYMAGDRDWKLPPLIRVCDAVGMSAELRAEILGGGT